MLDLGGFWPLNHNGRDLEFPPRPDIHFIAGCVSFDASSMTFDFFAMLFAPLCL